MYTNSLALLLPAFLLNAQHAFCLPQQQADKSVSPSGLAVPDPGPINPTVVVNSLKLENGNDYWTSFEAAGHVTSCENRTTSGGGEGDYITNMQAYLNIYAKGENPGSNGFKGMDAPLAGEGFYLGADAGYTSTQDCANACYTCLKESIAAGSRDTICWDVFGEEAKKWSVGGYSKGAYSISRVIRRCWMGFQPVA